MSPKPLEIHVTGEGGTKRPLPDSGMLVLGSSADRAGLRIDGQGVDDAHCAVGVVKGGGYAIKDLGSKYGTIVNGKKVTTARLAAGDTIVLGSRRLLVVDPANPSAAPAETEAAQSEAAQSEAPRREAPQREAKRPKASEPEAPKREPQSIRTASSAATDAGSGKTPARGGKGVPKRVGGYRVDRLLGRGGMGTVLLAEQESLNRPVALKLLPPKLAADAAFVTSFQKEARAAAALTHSNVVVVYDVGEEDGFHFLSMEYMERGSLEDRLKADGRVPWREVLDILHDASKGLVFAEEKGIVHRDIKPANLMQNAAGTIKIADLGLASGVEESESDGKKIFGTPHFIAPEQARGQAVDHRADLYSLGATAYYLLAGRTPFEGETTRDILRGHLTREPEPLGDRVASMPNGLEALVLKLLQKEPADRFQSAGALLAEVDRLRLEVDHGVAVSAGGKSGSKLGLILGGAVVAAGAVAFLVLGGGSGDETPDDDGGGEVAAAGPEQAGEPENGSQEDPPNGPVDSGDASILGAGSQSGDNGAGAAEDLEAALRERNLRAENSYLRIDATLGSEDRIAVLQELIEEFPGTDTASRAVDEIAGLRAELEAEAAREAAEASLLGDAEKSLRAACKLPTPDGVLPRPGDQLRALQAFTAPPDFPTDLLNGLLARTEDEIVAAARQSFDAALAEVERLSADGRFERMEEILRDLLPRFDLPEFEPGAEPAGLGELRLQGDTVRGRLNRLASESALWADHRLSEDRATIAVGMRGAGAVRVALEALDVEAALGALEALGSSLATDVGRELTAELRTDLEAGKAALDTVIGAFAAGEWRRKSVLDPRGGRTTARDAVAIDATGIHVDVKGEPQHIEWAVFADSTEALIHLFRERLDRDYTETERRGLSALIAISAASEAAELAAQVLDPKNDARFSPAESKALLELYSGADDWAQETPRFAREREAAELLGQTLNDAQDGIWSGAEVGLATLLSDYADTLLVSFLSDGSAWRDPADGESDD